MDLYIDMREIKSQEDFHILLAALLCASAHDDKTLIETLHQQKNTKLILLYVNKQNEQFATFLKKGHYRKRHLQIIYEEQGRHY